MEPKIGTIIDFETMHSFYKRDSSAPRWKSWCEVELFEALSRVPEFRLLCFSVDALGSILVYKPNGPLILSVSALEPEMLENSVVEYRYLIDRVESGSTTANLATLLFSLRLATHFPLNGQQHTKSNRTFDLAKGLGIIKEANHSINQGHFYPPNAIFDRCGTFVEADTTSIEDTVVLVFFGFLITNEITDLENLLRCWLEGYHGCLIIDLDNAMATSELFFGSLFSLSRRRSISNGGRLYVVASQESRSWKDFDRYWLQEFPNLHICHDITDVFRDGCEFYAKNI